MATSSFSVSLKLLIDTKNQKVLFAEAGKDFIDFLFTLLSLPVGTVIRLLSTNGMVGSLALGKLYSSFENLSDTYIQPNFNKDTLLKPRSPLGSPVTLLSLANDTSSRTKLYVCSGTSNVTFGLGFCGRRHAAHSPQAVCPGCGGKTSTEVTYIGLGPADPQVGSSGEGGFVKGVVTYMVMDDLEVKPMSTISSITMLNKFNVKEVGALEERIVSLKMDQGLKLLHASLRSKSVLTNVFLGNTGA
ncbi:hypothetical protein UlMin_025714 [Ulmus minor]